MHNSMRGHCFANESFQFFTGNLIAMLRLPKNRIFSSPVHRSSDVIKA